MILISVNYIKKSKNAKLFYGINPIMGWIIFNQGRKQKSIWEIKKTKMYKITLQLSLNMKHLFTFRDQP